MEMKRKQRQLLRKKDIRLLALLIVLSAVFEIFLSNDFGYMAQNPPTISIDLNAMSGGEAERVADGIAFHHSGDKAVFIPDNPVESYYLSLEFEGTEGYVSGSVHIEDESRADDFIKVNTFAVNPAGRNRMTIPVKSNGRLKGLSVTAEDGTWQELRLTSLEINAKPVFLFQWKRWVLILSFFLLCCLIKKCRLTDVVFQTKNPIHLFLLMAVIIFDFAVSGFIFSYANDGCTADIAYPLEGVSDKEAYAWMFDAYYHGRTDLAVAVSEEEKDDLAALDNPYDRSLREKSVSSRWEYAFYKGKYYAYFGSTPVLVYYFPYYFVHHALPDMSKAALFFTRLMILFLALSLLMAISVFRYKPNVFTVLLTGAALPAVTAAFMLQASADMYYLVYTSAFAFLAVYIFFSLAAYERRNRKSGILLYFFAGIALVLAVASRPTTVIPVFFLMAPLYICVLRERELAVRQKLGLVLGYAVPILTGAAMIMRHNYVRFDSPFEFGAVYQLTVSDIHYNRVFFSAPGLWSWFLNYWCRTLKIVSAFPFVELETVAVSDFGSGRFIWASRHFGVLSIPLNILLLFLPYLLSRASVRVSSVSKTAKQAMLICGFLAGNLILYIDFCIGGVFIRYTCDTLFVFAVLALAVAWSLLEERNRHVSRGVYALIIVSVLVGYALIFYNERNYIRLCYPDMFLRMKKFFSFGQCF